MAARAMSGGNDFPCPAREGFSGPSRVRENAPSHGHEVHQVFGRWSGRVTDERGDAIEVESVLGFAEGVEEQGHPL